MTNLQLDTDRTGSLEMSRTEAHMNRRWNQLRQDRDELQRAEDYLHANSAEARRAEAFLAEFQEMTDLRDALKEFLAEEEPAFIRAQGRHRWQPPIEGPTPVGSTMNTLANHVPNVHEILMTLVGGPVHLWVKDGEPGGYIGRLQAVTNGHVHMEDTEGNPMAPFPIELVTGAHLERESGPTSTIASGLMGPPDARQELPAGEMRAAVEAEKDVTRTGGQPSTEKTNGRGRRG